MVQVGISAASALDASLSIALEDVRARLDAHYSLSAAPDRAGELGTLVVVDAGVDDLSVLLGDLAAETDVLVLNAHQDGVEQITQALKQRHRLSTLHLVSHGSAGCLNLGQTTLGSSNLGHYKQQIESWSEVLQGSELLIYGCEVARGANGAYFLHQLSELTQANVAASTERVGRVDGRSRWMLDFQIGMIQSDLIFTDTLQQNYSGSFIPEVTFSIGEIVNGEFVEADSFVETDGPRVAFRFSLSEPPPPEGVILTISANEVSSINRLSAAPSFFGGDLEFTGLVSNGLAGPFSDISPALDFSELQFVVNAQEAEFSATLVSTQTDESLNGPSNEDNPTRGDIEDAADTAETIIWTVTSVDTNVATINPATTTQDVTFFDNDSQVSVPVPTVSISGTPTIIVEDEGTTANITLTLDQPAPSGGLAVSVGTESARGLADFDVFSPDTVFENIGGFLGFTDVDGVVVTIAEGATSAFISFPVFDDGDMPSDAPEAINDDLGLDVQTWTVDPQLAIDRGFGEALSEYNVDSESGSFTWTIADTGGQLNPPEAVDDAGTTTESQVLTGNVLTNDSDPDDGDTLSVNAINGEAANVGQQVTLASGALLTVDAQGDFTYDPNGVFNGLNNGDTAADSFTYTVTDENQTSVGVFNEATGTVNITIDGEGVVNTPPVAADDSYSADFNTALTIGAAGGVLANDSDSDGGDTLTAAIATEPSNGTVTLNDNGSFTYTPDAGFSGSDSFTYTVSDGNGG
ncbi:MAG: DUF4347 domain-containing protein, partial [Cyanobacteria bacterium P01_F01_bin.42]